MNNIFSPDTIVFIENEMCIEPGQYIERITAYSDSVKQAFKELGIYLIETRTDKKQWSDSFLLNAYVLIEKHDIIKDHMPKEYETADVLIRAFSRYKKWGLLELYRGAESDTWDPLPKISISLYSQMNIFERKEFDSFSQNFTIYRGTSYNEYISCGDSENGQYKEYGQSWTLDRQQAEYFAYKLGENKYLNTRRVVLKSTIDKKDVYAYLSQEKECIVNSTKLMGKVVPISIKCFG